MSNILIRDIDEHLDKALRVRAIKHGLSREAEIKSILEAAVARQPKKRTLAEALMDIPKMDSDIDDLFKRSSSSAREPD